MKRILFVFAVALGACNSETKNKANNDTTVSIVQNVDTIKKDTTKAVAPVKEKSEEQKAEERLNKIMNKRKNL